MKPWGQDPDKWLIQKRKAGGWRVRPPALSFWGKATTAATGEDAYAAFRDQTKHIRRN